MRLSDKEIQAFLQGMEYATRQLSDTKQGRKEALKIRRELQLLNKIYERNTTNDATKQRNRLKRFS